MDFKFLIDSVRKIILGPVEGWETIHSENIPVKYLRRNLLFPLILLASASAFLGSILFTNTELSKVYSVITGVKYFILICLVIYGTVFIFMEITNAFGLGKDFDSSFRIIACSAVPFLLCQVISRLFESFIFVNVLAFFGMYILWTGIEKMIHPPEQKKLPLLISATVVFIALFFIFNWLLNLVVNKSYFEFFA
jgi:hypothetical protein